MRLMPLATALLLSLCVSACGRSGTDGAATPAADAAVPVQSAEEAPPDAPPELPSLPTGDFRIASVTLGKAVDAEGQVRQAQDSFGTGDKIFASVISIGSSDGLTLSAVWTAADGAQVASAGQSLNPSTPTVTTFSIAQPAPWPTGGYRVDISVNGRIVETRRFLIQ